MKNVSPSALAAALLLLFASSAGAAGEARYGTHDQPLTGRPYQAMLALAGHLHATAQSALDGAIDEAGRGSDSEARFVSSIRLFARSAGDFHRMVAAYPAAPFEVPPRVSALAESARGIDARLRGAGALKSTYDDWRAVIDVLARMSLVLKEGDVEIPTAYVAPALSGSTLEQFQRLARELDQSAASAHQRALKQMGAYPARGAQFLGELGYFAARASELRAEAESGDVHTRPAAVLVDRLLGEAREADRTMRDAAVFAGVWSDSGHTITILERMASLVRS